jgi:hypothetical protein
VLYGQTKITVPVAGDEVPNSSDWNNLLPYTPHTCRRRSAQRIAIMDARAASFQTPAPSPCPVKTPSSRWPARQPLNVHHERCGAAEQVSDLDRLGDLGFRGTRSASVAAERPDTGRVRGDPAGHWPGAA